MAQLRTCLRILKFKDKEMRCGEFLIEKVTGLGSVCLERNQNQTPLGSLRKKPIALEAMTQLPSQSYAWNRHSLVTGMLRDPARNVTGNEILRSPFSLSLSL